MKKQASKIALSRETLCKLEQAIAGNEVTRLCQPSVTCDGTCWTGCTCVAACGP